MKAISGGKKIDFFALTQSELFLFIIFIILSYSVLRLDEEGNKGESTASLKRANEANIEILKSVYDSLGNLKGRLRITARELDSMKQYTNTGLGNCLDQGYLAEISIDEPESIVVFFFSNVTISDRLYEEGRNVKLSIDEFRLFGRSLLEESKNRMPECRYSVKIKDSDRLSKDQLKQIYHISNLYFNTLISQ